MFVWPKEDLNDEQVAAITEPGSVLVVACPGSGKTRALTYKICLELSRLSSEKAWVVAITYTNRAADEIHERIERLGVDTSQLWIGTIHSFCLEWILRPYALYHVDLRKGFRVIDAHASETLLSEFCKGTPDKVAVYECGYYFTPDGVRLGSAKPARRQAVAAVLDRYWAQLRQNRQLDYERILQCAFELISDVPSISILLGSLFSYVLVDEFQDTKEIQYAILGAILKAANGTAKAFLVGDPNQAIFGSLGGYAISPTAFSNMSGLALTPRGLVINYRSSKRIVDYFGNYNVHPANVVAEGKDKAYASLISFDRATGLNQLDTELVRLIRYNIETVGISQNEVCVVAPQWFHLASMTRRLVVALPEYRFDGPGIAPFARDIDNFWYKLSRIFLTEPGPQLYVRRLRWAGEVIAALGNAGVATNEISRNRLLRECNSILCADADGLAYLANVFAELFKRLGIDFAAFPILAEHYAAFFESSRLRIGRLVNEAGAAFAEIDAFKSVFAARTGITVSTIHGVKGAEFDTVIAYALLEGMVPNFGEANRPEAAKRLLYVTCSRARKNLHLVSETGRNHRGGPYLATEMLAACQFAYDSVPD
jgi:DNA helicase-2/ATP-dependent DNA helicase PcrA